MPQSLLETTIVPVIKNKCGSLTDSNNYRPIAIATITSKLFESVILMKCEEYLFTSDNQFGFKAQHSTEFCIYSLLEFIDYYKKRNTTVFVTFLDASKAFDLVNYWMLFSKLIDKNVPLFIVKLLVFWYTKQEMKVRWGNTISSSFKVGNGVKQGGILSPVLFNIYMDKLSIALNDTAVVTVTFLTVVQIIDYGREQCSGGNCPTTTKTGNTSREFLLPARQPSLLQTSNKQHIVL